jgi:hypothetical protein
MQVMKYFAASIGLLCCYCVFIPAMRPAIVSPKPIVTVNIADWRKSWSPWGWDRLLVKISLENPSNDTIRFIAGSCHWGDFLVTNTDSIRVDGHIACNVSWPTLYKIAPHQSISDSFSLTCYKKTGWKAGTVLKAGYRYYDGTGIKSLPKTFTFRKRKQDMIWSESFVIPTPKTND